MSDFTGLIAGAHLLGTPGLYDLNANLDIQRRLVGLADEARVFPRWPYWALVLRPLARLPYQVAVWWWLFLSCAALIGFVIIFPSVPRWASLLAVCWSAPVFDGLAQGQDTPFLLLFLGVAFWLHRNGRPFQAGLALSLCVLKYHLLVLVPILVIVQRRWRLLAGGVVGGTVLIVASLLVQGADWPLEHLQNISRPEIDTYPEIMPNFRGILYRAGNTLLGEIVAAILVAIWGAWLIRKVTFEQGLSLVLIGGMLVSHHAYIYDWIVLIPAFLILGASLPRSRPISVAMLSPLFTFQLSILPTHGGQLILMAFFFGYLVVISSEIGLTAGGFSELREGQ